MAGLSTKYRKRLIFYLNKKKKVISFKKDTPISVLKEIKENVENIVKCINYKLAYPEEIQKWIDDSPDFIKVKLEKAGLLENKYQKEIDISELSSPIKKNIRIRYEK